MEKRLIRIGDTRISEVCKHEIKEILDSNALSEGMWVSRLEKKFAEIMEVPYCILLNSGTSALIASLLACRYLYKNQVFAYLPVHLMGYATPQTRNYSGIGYSDAFIIEDACEALGTKVDGQ